MRTTAPSIRSRRRLDVGEGDGKGDAAAGWPWARGLDPSGATAQTALIAAAHDPQAPRPAARRPRRLAARAAAADVLVDNVNGYTIGADGRLIRFSGMLVGDDGRVEQLLQRGDRGRERTALSASTAAAGR